MSTPAGRSHDSVPAECQGVVRKSAQAIKSPAQLPVAVEVPHKGLASHRGLRSRALKPKEARSMLRDIAANLSAFYSKLEQEESGDTMPARAAKILAAIKAQNTPAH